LARIVGEVERKRASFEEGVQPDERERRRKEVGCRETRGSGGEHRFVGARGATKTFDEIIEGTQHELERRRQTARLNTSGG
jgi:hypothetical protein